jgi:hypothetical protein
MDARQPDEYHGARIAPVAQLDRVLPSEGSGRGFESRLVHHVFAFRSCNAVWEIMDLTRSPPCAGFLGFGDQPMGQQNTFIDASPLKTHECALDSHKPVSVESLL